MCGIVGFTRQPNGSSAADTAVVRAMLRPIAYRGPDATGVHVNGSISFGHLRLAIVDLAGGQQPRVDPTTGDALIFNGEIYGYSALAAELRNQGVNLIDRSDTEVLFRLLQRQGIEATLERVDGMFAFAFYEGRTGRLYLARDRLGEKPIYWIESGGALVFGSEPRAVLAHPTCSGLPVDPAAVATFLAFEYLPGTRSLRRGLRKLAPGHLLTFSSGRVEVRSYWWPDPDEKGTKRVGESEAERLDRLDTLLDQSVRDRLVADVPVGVFLSGGIDSSLVAALVAERARELTAFTASMAEDSYDETVQASTLTQMLGLRHEIIRIDDDVIRDAFNVVAARMDEPLADASLLPTTALCVAARRKVTVALGGDGADELFAGYMSFKANRAARLMAMLPRAAGRAVRWLGSAIPHRDNYMSHDFLLQQASHGVGLPPSRQWAAFMSPFSPEELDELWRPDVRPALSDTDDPLGLLLAARGARRWSTAELLYLFTTTYLPEDILQKVDRASMYASLEVRAPFLSRAFAEYSMSLPSQDKISGLSTKVLFKKLALRHLPRETVERRKHGFALPLSRLLRSVLKEHVGDVLVQPSSPIADWFDPRVVERLWSEHQSGRRDHRKKIWTLFCLATAVTNTATPR